MNDDPLEQEAESRFRERRARRDDESSNKRSVPLKIRPTKLRIIGGKMRGRSVVYLGDRITRPMKDSVRETLFNILSTTVKHSTAIDLFAGTGVLAIESLSREAEHAVAFEKSSAAAKCIRDSAHAIGAGERLTVLAGDTFRLAAAKFQELANAAPDRHWVVFCCPPYAMWTEAADKLFRLVQMIQQLAPAGSQIVVESDKYFDATTLPGEPWDIRPKGNVTLSFYDKP